MRFVTIVELTNVASGRKSPPGGDLAFCAESALRGIAGHHRIAAFPIRITREPAARHAAEPARPTLQPALL